ncbi:TetR/AcrR family transcriptional regulator [Rhizobium sp. 007]|uniref:TetR/AcrR family transcriptional regulator n=1 Tax=Rhizobium sp. 007 TaxID=2785056 RepID=UPI00188E77CA|nr:TetR/AcrR family transcriptional regulator [Rhizobium sp. 007]QPB19298.1 TetR/AcrR family transcriptional regulator [Rhizobium sp. 007]
MRVSREKFAENRQKILEVAGVMFRENGFDGVGVADIMKACGLTHGGFYGHFQSKEELQLEVSRALIARVEVRWKALIADAPDRPLEALLDHYVSWCSVDNPGSSCVFVALMEEVSRSSGAVRETFNDGLSTLVDILAEIVPGETLEERRKNGFTTLSSMMGAVSLARAVENRELAGQFLSTMREKLAPAKYVDA